MSSKGRRDSIDDFKEDSLGPLLKPKQPKPAAPKQEAMPPPPPPPAPVPSKESERNCAICNVALTESKYSEHFTSCMKAKAKAAAAMARTSKTVRPITDFINVKSSPSNGNISKPAAEQQASSGTASNVENMSDATSIVLPYCPVCGRIIKTDRVYASHLKQCAKKYNVAPDLLLELSKKQMTLQVEKAAPSPSNSKSNSASAKPVKKRPAKFFEMPSSMEDEQLQLAVALSASVMETHVTHLPIASIAENCEPTKPAPKPRLKRPIAATLGIPRDPAEAQIRLLELVAERFSCNVEGPKRQFIPLLKESTLGDAGSRLFHLACSLPSLLIQEIRNSESLSRIPAEFQIDTCDIEFQVDVSDSFYAKLKHDSPKVHISRNDRRESLVQSETTFHECAQHSPRLELNNSCDEFKATEDISPKREELLKSDGITQTEDVLKVEVTDQEIQVSSEPSVESHVTNNMLALLNNEDCCDVQFLSSDGLLIGGHRLILFAHCPGLISQNALLSVASNNLNESLSSFPASFIRAFLEFVYAGRQNAEFDAQIKEVFQSFQQPKIVIEDQEPDQAGGMSDSFIYAVANDVSPPAHSFHKEEMTSPGKCDQLPSETPSLRLHRPDDSPIVLSSPSPMPQTVDDEKLASQVCDSDSLPSVSPRNYGAQLRDEVQDLISPGAVAAIAKDAALCDEDGDPLPPIQTGDEWLDFGDFDQNYGMFSEEQQEIPAVAHEAAPQFVITEEENDLIAEFSQITGKIQPKTNSPGDEPIKKPKLTVAGKTRPRLSIVGLTSVAPAAKTKKGGVKEAKTAQMNVAKTPVTPALAALRHKTTPPYSQMATPNLVKLLGKYGVRKLPKKHMVMKLKEIHSALKPKETQTTPSASFTQPSTSRMPAAKPPSKLAVSQPAKPQRLPLQEPSSSESEGDEVNENDPCNDDSDHEAEMTLEPNALSLLDDDDDDEDDVDGDDEDDLLTQFFSQSQAKTKKPKKAPKIVLHGEEFTEQVAAFIRSNRQLYNDLLQFKPLAFKDIYAQVRKVGNFACSKQQLVDFLDEQCITFRLTPGKSHRPPPPPPVEKKPKQSKKQQSQTTS